MAALDRNSSRRSGWRPWVLIVATILIPLGMLAVSFVSTPSDFEVAEMDVDISVELLPTRQEISLGERPKVSVTLVNNGMSSVTLVEPGDESVECRRTPYIEWSHYTPPTGPRKCGNTNPIKSSEVFTLRPGERRTLTSWVREPNFSSAGKHLVTVTYTNLPDFKNWSPDSQGVKCAKARHLVSKSTPVSVVSNSIEIEVK